MVESAKSLDLGDMFRLAEGMSPGELEAFLDELPAEALQAVGGEGVRLWDDDIRENQLVYYKPVSEEALKVHLSLEHTVGAFGGKGSSKTDTMLVEMLILGTGIVPDSLAGVYPKQKVKAPGKYRIVVESITTTLEPIILPKLKWWIWDGIDEPGGRRGHWGWVPKNMLIGGDWDKSWNAKNRILTLTNNSFYQFCSFDQSPEDFASGRFHAILHDEPPPHSIYRENLARVAGYGGTIYLSMTPPDEAGGLNVDWIVDEIYEPGQEKSETKDPDILAVTLFAEHNHHLDQEQVANRARQMSPEQREVFLHGKFISMAHVVHPLFTDIEAWWCFECNEKIYTPHEGKCTRCGGKNIESFSHVKDFEYNELWPAVFVLDPHPRKPHMMEWIAVDVYDDAWHVAELQMDGEPAEVAERVSEIEYEFRMNVCARLIDPNMGQSPSGSRRRATWRDDFAEVGLYCDLPNDDFPMGRSRINESLKPDIRTRRPRMMWHRRCTSAIRQYKRYRWDEWARYTGENRDAKQKAREKDDDFPAMDRYFMNEGYTFDGLKHRNLVLKRGGTRPNGRSGY